MRTTGALLVGVHDPAYANGASFGKVNTDIGRLAYVFLLGRGGGRCEQSGGRAWGVGVCGGNGGGRGGIGSYRAGVHLAVGACGSCPAAGVDGVWGGPRVGRCARRCHNDMLLTCPALRVCASRLFPLPPPASPCLFPQMSLPPRDAGITLLSRAFKGPVQFSMNAPTPLSLLSRSGGWAGESGGLGQEGHGWRAGGRG